MHVEAENDAAAQFAATIRLQNVFAWLNVARANGSQWLDSSGPEAFGGFLSVSTGAEVHFSMANSTMSDNGVRPEAAATSLSAGGAIYLNLMHPNSTISIDSSRFLTNYATAPEAVYEDGQTALIQGGALYVYTSGLLDIKNSSFQDNSCNCGATAVSSVAHGGAVSFQAPIIRTASGPSIRLENTEFRANRITAYGLGPGGYCLFSGGAVSIQLRHVRVVQQLKVVNCSFIANEVTTFRGDAQGGALAVYIGSSGNPAILASPFELSGANISQNGALVFPRLSDAQVALKGAGVFLRAEVAQESKFIFVDSDFCRNGAMPNAIVAFASRARSEGAAILLDITPLAAANGPLSSSVVFVRSCSFVDNQVVGSSCNGGALRITGRPRVVITNSTFADNTVSCAGSVMEGGSCGGGALSAEFVPEINATNCVFVSNRVVSDGSGADRCFEGGGGAIVFKGSLELPSVLRALRSKFLSNTASTSVSFGGAVRLDQSNGSFVDCLFFNSSVIGEQAVGGALASVFSSVTVENTTFHCSSADAVLPPTLFAPCSFGSTMFAQMHSLGGSIALILARVSRHRFVDVLVTNTSAITGGAFSISNYASIGQHMDTFEIRNVTVKNTAADSGAALFATAICESWNAITQFCDSLIVENSHAISYGPRCASGSNSFEADFDRHEPQGLSVASGQQLALSFRAFDIWRNTIRVAASDVSVALEGRASARLLSGASEDRVFPSEGIYQFREFSLLGDPGARAKTTFALRGVVRLCPNVREVPLSVFVEFQIATCMPSSVNVGGVCETCPAQSYALVPNATKCEPCDEDSVESHSDEFAPNWCLFQERPRARTDSEHVSNETEAKFEIAEGFYPSPTMYAPSHIAKCPNEACLGFFCKVPLLHTAWKCPPEKLMNFFLQPLIQPNLEWLLNCSGCPHNSAHTNPSDCHCELGYEGRLCSRCSCDQASNSSAPCYFYSGEREEHECILCKQQSTAVIAIAIFCLFASMVVFLLFQRSAVALFLAEVAIAVTLLLLGIGEAWILDLLLLMGLLFLATSFSKRIQRRILTESEHSAPHGGHAVQSDGEDAVTHSSMNDSDGHHDGAHHDHEADSRTAAMAKIVIFFLQSATSLVDKAAWPSWIDFIMHGLEAINVKVSGVECFAPSILSSPLGKLLFQLTLPWLLGISITLAAMFSAVLMKIDPAYRIRILIRALRRSPRSSNTVIPSDSDTERVGSEISPLLAGRNAVDEAPIRPSNFSLDDLRARVVFSVLFLISASYFELSNTVLEILRPCEHEHMAAYPWIHCSFNDGQYSALLITAIVFFVAYSIGIPAFFGFVLLRNRRRIRAGDPALEAKYGFLYESYTAKYYWFELIWFLRRILLSLAVSVLPSRPGYQMAAILAVLLGSIALHRFLKPFSTKVANWFDLGVTCVLLFAVAMGFVSRQYRSRAENHGFVLQNMIWATCALMAGLLFVALLAPCVGAVRKYFRAKLHKS